MDPLNRERMAHVLTNENARLAPGAGQSKRSIWNYSPLAHWIKGGIVRAALWVVLPVALAEWLLHVLRLRSA